LFCQLTIVGFIWIANRGLSAESAEDIPPYVSKYPSVEPREFDLQDDDEDDDDLITKKEVTKQPSEETTSSIGLIRNSKDLDKAELEILPKGKETTDSEGSSFTGTTRKRK